VHATPLAKESDAQVQVQQDQHHQKQSTVRNHFAAPANFASENWLWDSAADADVAPCQRLFEGDREVDHHISLVLRGAEVPPLLPKTEQPRGVGHTKPIHSNQHGVYNKVIL
jgi:hypothetical protein